MWRENGNIEVDFEGVVSRGKQVLRDKGIKICA